MKEIRNNMSKFSYYKRVVNEKTIQLHFREDRGEFIIGKVYPIMEDNSIYNDKEMVELFDCDSWLDEGIKVGIFDCKPIPKQIG
tara:strand:+ start:4069 stop:4320 length:252 start_codon:yes stop_codon:yes gene_type:complete